MSARELFDTEITKCFARIRLHTLNQTEFNRIPRPFILRLLHEYIGSRNRRDSYVGIEIYAAIDILFEELQKTNKPLTREEILRDVCEAFIRSTYAYKITNIQKRSKPNRKWTAPPGQVLGTAFLVAIIMQYTEVQVAMLESGKISEHTVSSCLGPPHDMAIRLGYEGTLKMFSNAGANMSDQNLRSISPSALRLAAINGYAGVIDWVLKWVPQNIYQGEHIMVDLVIEVAAQYQQWHTVELILDIESTAEMTVVLQSVLCSAAKYGKNDLILRIIKQDIPTQNSYYGKRFPLREAAGSGHLSTCRLLIEHGAIANEYDNVDANNKFDVIARYVARGGNMQILHLFRNAGFWRDANNFHLLPVAAEWGHLEMAKYAVEQGMDTPQRKSNNIKVCLDPGSDSDESVEIRYPDSLRHFALFRAVVSGHVDIVRWLIRDLKIDPDVRVGMSSDDLLTPLSLAVDAGNSEMATILVQELDATPLCESKRSDHIPYRRRVARQCALYPYGEALMLGSDYRVDHLGLRGDVQAAWRAATVPRKDEVEKVSDALRSS